MSVSISNFVTKIDLTLNLCDKFSLLMIVQNEKIFYYLEEKKQTKIL